MPELAALNVDGLCGVGRTFLECLGVLDGVNGRLSEVEEDTEPSWLDGVGEAEAAASETSGSDAAIEPGPLSFSCHFWKVGIKVSNLLTMISHLVQHRMDFPGCFRKGKPNSKSRSQLFFSFDPVLGFSKINLECWIFPWSFRRIAEQKRQESLTSTISIFTSNNSSLV